MSGTKLGGLKARDTNLLRYGANYYEGIGRAGGAKSRGGGFAGRPELARAAGQKGGLAKVNRSKCRQGHPYENNHEIVDRGGYNSRRCLICHQANLDRRARARWKRETELKKNKNLDTAA